MKNVLGLTLGILILVTGCGGRSEPDTASGDFKTVTLHVPEMAQRQEMT